MADQNKSIQRPPVIVVLGHVDHGKTTLLDYIRKANVAAREAGGITQSIGAYEINRGGRKLTFIDTPGHAAFSAMRERGAQLADIAILVVAADDGVQPQTKEAIKIIKESNIPFIVAITKVDKDGIDATKAKNELTAENVLLEGYGGNVSFQEVSGTTGKGVDDLIELVALSADLIELPVDIQAKGKGIILEAKIDSRRGTIVSAIVLDGTLNAGDVINAGTVSGKVKGLENFLGEKIKSAQPSSPVLILGFDALPKIGEAFITGGELKKAETKAVGQPKSVALQTVSDDVKSLNLVLKGDVSGSLEVLTQIIESLPKPPEVNITIIDKRVGDITDGDVSLATSTKAMIIGFNVKAGKSAKNLAEVHGIEILTSEIVYELIKAIEDKFEILDKDRIKGDLEILGVFGKKEGTQQVIGGKIILGELRNNTTVAVERKESVLGEVKILNLQQNKKDVQTLSEGEGGLLADSKVAIKVGDHLIVR